MADFKNYQLWRTNTKLGGQLQWDLIIESDADELYVSDFHLSPISKNIPYNKKVNEDLLKYNHQYNVQTFYNQISGNFYSIENDPKFQHNWPIIREDDTSAVDTHDSTLEMGVSRDQYKLYQKTFEAFVPVWIENLSDTLSFDINIYGYTKNQTYSDRKLLSTRRISLKLLDDNYTFHNKFVQYFNDYIDYVGLNESDGNELVKISLDTQSSTLKGFNVETGSVTSLTSKNLLINILSRERPLMEVDSMIINEFPDHHLIARQLFNFNLHFNFEDILSGLVRDMLDGQFFEVDVTTNIDDNSLEIKDFYTNYDRIPKKLIKINSDDSEDYSKAPNVLDYLKDNKYINYQNFNKFSPSLIHWSLADNNDYVFNVYNGFGGYYKETKNSTLNMIGQQDDFPNLINSDYIKTLNNVNWCNHNITDGGWTPQQFFDFLLETDKGKYTKINDGITQNIRYLKSFSNSCKNPTYVYSAVASLSLWNTLARNYKKYKLYDYLYVISVYLGGTSKAGDDNVLLFISLSSNYLTFVNILKILKNYKFNTNTDDEDLKNLQDVLNALLAFLESRVNPSTCKFYKSLLINRAPSPSYSTTEIEYYKDDNQQFNQYVLRYDGMLRPTFINDTKSDSRFFNYYYTKKDYTKDEISESNTPYNLYSSSGYDPSFPSLQYYSINQYDIKYSEIIYKEENSEENSEEIANIDGIIKNIPEYKWFNRSLLMNCKTEIDMVLKSEAGKTVKDLVLEKLKGIYPNFKDNVEYVYNLYNISIDYDYDDSELEPIKNQKYIYNIKLTLK